jgi:hypothetical protein
MYTFFARAGEKKNRLLEGRRRFTSKWRIKSGKINGQGGGTSLVGPDLDRAVPVTMTLAGWPWPMALIAGLEGGWVVVEKVDAHRMDEWMGV